MRIQIVSLSLTLFLLSCSSSIADNRQEEDKILAINQRISSQECLVSLMAPIHKNIGVIYAIGNRPNDDFLQIPES